MDHTQQTAIEQHRRRNGQFGEWGRGEARNFETPDIPVIRSVDADQVVHYHRDGKLHRTDGPAVEYLDGGVEYWRNGLLQRTDGPALSGEGVELWYLNGMRHRDDGPAATDRLGQSWYRLGHLHRDGDQPAVITASGERQWWFNGELHRDGDPAIVFADGTEAYYLDGEYIEPEQFQALAAGRFDSREAMHTAYLEALDNTHAHSIQGFGFPDATDVIARRLASATGMPCSIEVTGDDDGYTGYRLEVPFGGENGWVLGQGWRDLDDLPGATTALRSGGEDAFVEMFTALRQQHHDLTRRAVSFGIRPFTS